MDMTTPLADALRTYLARSPVTGSWTEAVSIECPLLSSRRGTPDQWRHTGLGYHRVVMKASWLSRFVGREAAQGRTFGGPVGGGEKLWLDLLGLHGVEAAANVTALLEPGRPHRLTHWLRLDTEQWEVVVPPRLMEKVADPWSTQ